MNGDVYPLGMGGTGRPRGSSIQAVQLTADLANGASATANLLNDDYTWDGSSTLDDCYNQTGVQLLDTTICYVLVVKGRNTLYPAQLESCPAPTYVNVT